MKIANLFGAVLISVLLLTSGICQANMPRSKMFIGGFTVNSRISELTKVYGETPIVYSSYEGSRTAIYGNNLTIAYNGYRGNVVLIHVTANNG